MKDEIIDNLNFLEVYKDDLDLKSAKVWKNEAMDYIKRHDDEKDQEDVFLLDAMVKKLVENDKVYPFIWYLKNRWAGVMAEEDLKEYINIILEMKQNIELQAAHLEG